MVWHDELARKRDTLSTEATFLRDRWICLLSVCDNFICAHSFFIACFCFHINLQTKKASMKIHIEICILNTGLHKMHISDAAEVYIIT